MPKKIYYGLIFVVTMFSAIVTFKVMEWFFGTTYFSEKTFVLIPMGISFFATVLIMLNNELRGSSFTETKNTININDELDEKIKNNFELKIVLHELERTIERLKSSIKALTLRGNTNLVIGIIIAGLAITILASVLWKDLAKDASLWINLLSKISLSFLIQLFSFFFLRLYRSSLEDIKYFQNELTNVESVKTAFATALIFDDEETRKQLTLEIVKTERNFILKKGESTIHTQKEALNASSDKEYLKALKTIFPKVAIGNTDEH